MNGSPPKGNTLVTESERGRVFELTREKEIVWEYITTPKYKMPPMPSIPKISEGGNGSTA
jgi:hypothetical protein